MNSLKRIVTVSSQTEPYAGGTNDFNEQIKASLPFLLLIKPVFKKVLVIGCGEGYEVKWLADHNYKVIGLTKSKKEAEAGRKKYGVTLKVGDMHELPFADNTFDCIYASNVLEHSVAPYIALLEWRRVLRKQGWLVTVMPSKRWLPEYYHYSVLTHSQMKDLLFKAGFTVLAGPETKTQIDMRSGDIFYDLGRGWGHYDGYVAEKGRLPKNTYMVGNHMPVPVKSSLPVTLIKSVLKYPYNKVRIWYARHHRE